MVSIHGGFGNWWIGAVAVLDTSTRESCRQQLALARMGRSFYFVYLAVFLYKLVIHVRNINGNVKIGFRGQSRC